MTLESIVAWVVIIGWTLISAASVIFAYYGVTVKRPLREEAKADLEAVPKDSKLYEVAKIQASITNCLYRAQQTLLGHQSLFFVAGALSLILRIVRPLPYDGVGEPLDIVRVLRSIGIPIDLVLAQGLIVVAQIFLHGVGAGLRRLYHLNTKQGSSKEKEL